MKSFKDITKENFSDILGDLITEKKEKTGLTNNQIADEIGIGQAQLSKILNQKIELGISSLVKIARYFGVSTDYLLGLTKLRSTTKEFKTIYEVTGLLDGSITNLANMNKNDKESIYILNLLLDQTKEISKTFKRFLLFFKKYVLYLLNNNTEKYEEYKYIPISEQDIREDYERELQETTYEEKEYIHLFKISEVAKQIAKKVKICVIDTEKTITHNKRKK